MASVPAPPPSRPSRTVTVDRGFLGALFAEASPLDLRIVGRTLLHAALVGAAAGAVGAAFYFGLELVQRVFLEQLTGYIPLRAAGETVAADAEPGRWRPWLLIFVPAGGALLSGLLTLLAPEARGG